VVFKVSSSKELRRNDRHASVLQENSFLMERILLDQLQKAYYAEQVKSIKQLASMHSKQETEKILSEGTIFKGDIPAFRRLAIIYEKQKEYEKASNICASAMQYYTHFKMLASAADFAERKEKLLKRIK